MKKISVIIPMYNAERYITQCVRSVLGQLYQNLEVIVVDDGSADKGAAICGKLAETDGRIRLLRQENRGVSAARNHGIDAAQGEYVFFLDSDDAIHPRLLEEMLRHAEESGAELAFCGYRKCDNDQLEILMKGAGEPESPRKPKVYAGQGQNVSEEVKNSEKPEVYAGQEQNVPREPDDAAAWLTADEAGTEEWFHVKYTDSLSGIGGKLILREAIGNLRFDDGLRNGEDTFFLYQLIRRQVRSVYCLEEWYYYRMHGESATGSAGIAKGTGYCQSAGRIRDGEYERGHAGYAMRWETLLTDQIRRSYAALMGGDAGGSGEAVSAVGAVKAGKSDRDETVYGDAKEPESARLELRKIAAAEMGHPLYGNLCFSNRVLFRCCFSCYPLYVILNKITLNITNRRSR